MHILWLEISLTPIFFNDPQKRCIGYISFGKACDLMNSDITSYTMKLPSFDEQLPMLDLEFGG